MTEEIKAGDEVRLSRSLAESLSDPDAHLARGKVTGIREENGFEFASVEWNRKDVPDLVNVLNLRKERKRSEGHVASLGGFSVGDRVKHSDEYLRRVGADREIANMRGEVVELKKDPVARAKVMWEGDEEAKGVLLSNLERVRSRGR